VVSVNLNNSTLVQVNGVKTCAGYVLILCINAGLGLILLCRLHENPSKNKIKTGNPVED